MDRLRRECPWDREQTHKSLTRYLLEETYETLEAIEALRDSGGGSGDRDHLREELGDLLMQVYFHARIAEETPRDQGGFDLDDVARGIVDKLVRRHPHVFAGVAFATDADRSANWEAQKAQERDAASHRKGEGAASVLGDVPKALPALSRAERLGKRASRVGFDWPDAAGVREKLNEELHELDSAATPEAVAEELGDALFTLVNLGRKLSISAEEALRAKVG